MRWILVTLILLNGAYFGWEYVNKAQRPPAPLAVKESLDKPGGEKLMLLTERLPSVRSPSPPPTIAPEKRPAEITTERLPAAVKSNNVCSVVGPFLQQGEGQSLVTDLAGLGIEARLEPKQSEKEIQHWVILPPAESRRRALQVLRELQARKIDSYLISSGEMKNAISLGLFTRDELAKGVQEKIQEAGYPAEVRRKERSETEFWVWFRQPQALEKTQKPLDTYLQKDSGLKISNSPCETFAQSN